MSAVWLWRIVVIALLLASGLFGWMAHDHPAIAVAGSLLILGAHAGLLAVEFAIAARGNSAYRSEVPGASLRQRLAAWWEEVYADARLFGWEQPFRVSAHPSSRRGSVGRRGVVFVHGFLCNRGVWNTWIDRLEPDVPYRAIDVPSLFGPIEGNVQCIDEAVRALEDATGLAPVVVAHSMGGLCVRAWLAAHSADRRVHRVITVATPHHGTGLARLAFGANVRQMHRGSHWLRTLAASEPPERFERFVCFYGLCDNVVVPASSAAMRGADNRHLPGVAHLAMLYRPEVWDEVMRCLAEPASPMAVNDVAAA